MDIRAFWKAVLSQDKINLPKYFHNYASIRWHCTNELFTVDEYVRANCEYPGDWNGSIERIETIDDRIITVVRVYPADNSSSFHVVSFLRIHNNRILELDEYWADDGSAPQWRQAMKIGNPIR
ncbi:MAG: nuclear transport factor 2 family protein [Tissierellia bacterium]|nr:nuclear transport factor 2 family protein [Tissierellia bacterium]